LKHQNLIKSEDGISAGLTLIPKTYVCKPLQV